MCVLRPWRDEDVGDLVRHADDREVWLNLRDRFPHPYTAADAREWIRAARAQRPVQSFAIVVEGRAGGGIGIHPMTDVHRRTAEIGYWLGRAYWNRGIATEAVRATAEYAFSTFDLARLEAVVYEWNPASARVLEKAGFELEGRLRRAVTKDDRTIDALLYSRIR